MALKYEPRGPGLLLGKSLARQRIAVRGYSLCLQRLVGIAHGHFGGYGAYYIVKNGNGVHLACGLIVNQKGVFPCVVLRQKAFEQAQAAAVWLRGGL